MLFFEQSLRSWLFQFYILKERALEKATYSCPCAHTGARKNIPNLSKVCPCALFMVIEYDNRAGIWILFRVKCRIILNCFSNFNNPQACKVIRRMWTPSSVACMMSELYKLICFFEKLKKRVLSVMVCSNPALGLTVAFPHVRSDSLKHTLSLVRHSFVQ